jgi:hypothetical protein
MRLWKLQHQLASPSFQSKQENGYTSAAIRYENIKDAISTPVSDTMAKRGHQYRARPFYRVTKQRLTAQEDRIRWYIP